MSREGCAGTVFQGSCTQRSSDPASHICHQLPLEPEFLLLELLATGFILPHILSFLHRAHCSGAPYIGVLRWGFLPWSSLHHGFVDQALFIGGSFSWNLKQSVSPSEPLTALEYSFEIDNFCVIFTVCSKLFPKLRNFKSGLVCLRWSLWEDNSDIKVHCWSGQALIKRASGAWTLPSNTQLSSVKLLDTICSNGPAWEVLSLE